MAASNHQEFQRTASSCATLAALAGWWYAIAFVIVRSPGMSALALMVGGLLPVVAVVGLYERVRAVQPSVALLALLVIGAGLLGTIVHGGYELAVVLHPPAVALDPAAANPVDPRGLLAFGATGVGVALFSWLIHESAELPRGLAIVGYVSALLSVILYLARLVVFDPTHPLVLGPALVEGFVVNPVWYLWLGVALRREAGVEAISAAPA